MHLQIFPLGGVILLHDLGTVKLVRLTTIRVTRNGVHTVSCLDDVNSR